MALLYRIFSICKGENAQKNDESESMTFHSVFIFRYKLSCIIISINKEYAYEKDQNHLYIRYAW